MTVRWWIKIGICGVRLIRDESRECRPLDSWYGPMPILSTGLLSYESAAQQVVDWCSGLVFSGRDEWSFAPAEKPPESASRDQLATKTALISGGLEGGTNRPAVTLT